MDTNTITDADKKTMISKLRGLPTKEYLLRNTRRVSVFDFKSAFMLLCKNYEAQKIKDLFGYLLEEGIIFKVEQIDNGSVDITFKGNLTTTDLFIWDKEDNSVLYKILVGLFLLAIVFVGLFQVFPRWHRYVLYYLRYPILGFLIFILVSAIIRVIVYLITLFFCKEQCWIWPNLFADCGFFESFRPMYEWTETKEENEDKEKQE